MFLAISINLTDNRCGRSNPHVHKRQKVSKKWPQNLMTKAGAVPLKQSPSSG
jgi:hypothetical protein